MRYHFSFKDDVLTGDWGNIVFAFLLWILVALVLGLVWVIVGASGIVKTEPSHKPLKPEKFYVSILERNNSGYLAERIGKEQWVLLEIDDNTLQEGDKLKVVAQKKKDETYTAELGTKYDSKVPVYDVNRAEPAKVEKDER